MRHHKVGPEKGRQEKGGLATLLEPWEAKNSGTFRI